MEPNQIVGFFYLICIIFIYMKIDVEKIAEVVISVFAIGVGILLIGTVSTFIYAIVKSIFF